MKPSPIIYIHTNSCSFLPTSEAGFFINRYNFKTLIYEEKILHIQHNHYEILMSNCNRGAIYTTKFCKVTIDVHTSQSLAIAAQVKASGDGTIHSYLAKMMRLPGCKNPLFIIIQVKTAM
jgi:hypothetical protein